MMWFSIYYWAVAILLLLIPIIGMVDRWRTEREWKQFENDLITRNERDSV